MHRSTAEGQPKRRRQGARTAAECAFEHGYHVHAIAATAKPRTADSYANITGVPLWGQQHYVNGYRCADGTIMPRARVNDDACDCVSWRRRARHRRLRRSPAILLVRG